LDPSSRYTIVTLPQFQRQMVDWLDMNTKHPVFMLVEVDVTDVRVRIRSYRSYSHQPLSLNAYITGCFAHVLSLHPELQAYKKGRKRVVIFTEVDVALLVERDIGNQRVPLPSLIRSADKLSLAEIDTAIREARSAETPQAWAEGWLGVWLMFPASLRRFILRRILANPFRRKRMTGTTMVSAAGMFGRGTGWGITPPSYTISLVTGSLSQKACVIDGRIEPREILGLTVGFDHDLVNGAVAARFAQRFKTSIESCHLLDDLESIGTREHANGEPTGSATP
jgi:pyruvate/2-oxoglutarate dehydrogenase complex dihydrolipoamide acyltransferase (E2) component